MRIALLGVGAIGSLLAGALAEGGCDLVLYARGARGSALAETGLLWHGIDGDSEQHSAERWVVTDGEVSEPLRGCADVAILCGKSDSTAALSVAAEALLRPDGIAVSLQNGLGHAELLVGRLGRHRVLAGSTTHAAMLIGPGEVRWTGEGAIRLGSLAGSDLSAGDRRVSLLFDALEEAGLSPEQVFNAEAMLWSKLLINVAINPLASICGVRNGELLSRPDLHQQALDAMMEAATVARAEGVDLTDFEFEDELNNVLAATAENRCSMLQDVMAGRPTEIGAICGEVVKRGEEHGIPTPLNQQLLTLVRGIEHSTQTG